MKKLYILLLLMAWLASPATAQDKQFSQFFSVPLYLAPSFSGATQQHRIASTYRNQWLGIPGGFVTYVLSYDHFFTKYNSGLGVLFMRDAAGSAKLGDYLLSLNYSYDFLFSDVWHIRPGVNFQYSVYNLDFNKLVFPDQLTTDGGTNGTTGVQQTKQNVGNIDGATSIIMYTEKIWFGGCVDHLFMPNQSLFGDNTRLPMKFTVFGGAQIAKKSRLLKPDDDVLSFAFLYTQQDIYRQLNMGFYMYQSPLVLGIWYRGIPVVNSVRGDALVFLVGLKAFSFSVGYSYDFTISNLISSSHGAHELSLTYEFTTSRKKKRHAMPCPEF